MRYGPPRFYELLEECADIADRKNQNYAKDSDPLSNFKMCTEVGVPAYIGAWIRMSDKWARIKELLKGKPDLVGESLADSLRDLANYALLTLVLYEEETKHE